MLRRKTYLSESARNFFYPCDTWSQFESSDGWSIHNFCDQKMQAQAMETGQKWITFLLRYLLSLSEIPHCDKNKTSLHNSHPYTLSSTTVEIKTLSYCPYFPSLCIILQYVVSEMAMRNLSLLSMGYFLRSIQIPAYIECLGISE